MKRGLGAVGRRRLGRQDRGLDAVGLWGRRLDRLRQAANRAFASLRHTIEEINDSGLQRILGTYDEESTILDQLLEDFRSVSQMVR